MQAIIDATHSSTPWEPGNVAKKKDKDSQEKYVAPTQSVRIATPVVELARYVAAIYERQLSDLIAEKLLPELEKMLEEAPEIMKRKVDEARRQVEE